MAQKVLNHQHIHIFVIQMRGKGVPESVTGYIKMDVEIQDIQNFFEIVFHRSDGQAVAFFWYEKRFWRLMIHEMFSERQPLG